eukprot:1695088-Amphidinium_carterae.1
MADAVCPCKLRTGQPLVVYCYCLALRGTVYVMNLVSWRRRYVHLHTIKGQTQCYYMKASQGPHIEGAYQPNALVHVTDEVPNVL